MLERAPRRPSPRRSLRARRIGVSLFLTLVFVVCFERRIAELDLVPNDELLFENDEVSDGVEIVDRLVGLVDIRPPQPPAPVRVAVATVVVPAFAFLPDAPRLVRVPRAPPALSPAC